jgi:NAD(P)-dependent dehydrogenase (short-subunit alcohol dehydrogenase family)
MSANTGKIALITGANKGIGLETARQLGPLGVTILLGARNLSRGEEAASTLRARGVESRPIKLDVNSETDRQAAAKLIEKDYGRLDILINNAGVLLDSRNGNETSITSSKILHETFETNFFSAVALTQTLLPLLRKSDAGRIVNLSSILSIADPARYQRLPDIQLKDLRLRCLEGRA